jgi:hypothetical protein
MTTHGLLFYMAVKLSPSFSTRTQAEVFQNKALRKIFGP